MFFYANSINVTMKISANKFLLLMTALVMAVFVTAQVQAEDTIVIARFSSRSFEPADKFQVTEVYTKKQNQFFQKTTNTTKNATSSSSTSTIKERVRVIAPDQRSLEKDLSQAPVKSNIPSFFLNLLMLKF